MSKWVHVIGVAGVTTSAVAVMFKELGWKVTGSDKGFYPPISTYLEENKIDIQPGFKPERLTDDEGNHPDIVVFQGLKGSSNKELIEAEKLGLKLMNYPEVLAEYVLKDSASIVVAGSYGKTTITSALAHIFHTAEIDVSYMFGGISLNLKHHVKPKTDITRFSVLEGDEYMISLEDRRSKFFMYKPTHLILNSAQWDHPDMFPTETDYLENFTKLIKLLPENSILVANANDENVVKLANQAPGRVVYYSANLDQSYIEKPEWFLSRDSKPLPSFIRMPQQFDSEVIPYEKKIIGDFNEENLLAASVLAYELGVKKERIQDAIASFNGIKRRLEIRLETETAMVIDDFGSSPAKAEGALAAIRQDFSNSRIIAVFEPNTGNRVSSALELYRTAFKDADAVILPRFTKLPKIEVNRFDANELAATLINYNIEVSVENEDDKLIEKLTALATRKNTHTIVCFLGSHGFRGMIEELISKLSDD